VQPISFAKGHGTENDFVIIPDPDGALNLSDSQVRTICDRRAGIGADGTLRVVRGRNLWEGYAYPQLWFMDYLNGDGSTAAMCGNGARVFARYLFDRGWAGGQTIDIGTRDGPKQVSACADGRFRVAMGTVTVDPAEVKVWLRAPDMSLPAIPADVGNSHAVAFVDDLDSLDLASAPTWSPPDRFSDGVNIEFVQLVGKRHIATRIHERGSGETRSCGTGVCAATAVAAWHCGDRTRPVTYRVDVPGGTLEVELTEGNTYLTGPAEIVAAGTLTIPG
jgi:diaminopimelate epimerase